MSVTYKRQTPLVILTGKHERIFFSVLSCVRQMDFFTPSCSDSRQSVEHRDAPGVERSFIPAEKFIRVC